MKYVRSVFAAWVALAQFAGAASALTIDEFQGLQSVQPQPGSAAALSLITDSGAIGGTRGLEGRVTFPLVPTGGDMFVEVSGGRFSHSQDSNVAGYSVLTWDGDFNPAVLTKNGLPAVDFLQDGATALTVDVVTFDYPSQQSLTLSVTLYDAYDSTRFSTGSVTLGGWVISPTTFTIPFVAFVRDPAASAPVDFGNVGAVTLRVSSENAPAADLQLEWVGTNGLCRIVPDSEGRVIDQCGVCAGDGTSCLDCNGVPFGGANIDQCGVCGGDGTTCLDCAGVAYGPALVDRCGVCMGDGNSCITCTERDLTPISVTLDSGAKKLEKAIQRAGKKLRANKRDAKTANWIDKTLTEVHRLQIRNWVLSWVFPRKLTVCDNEAVCTFTSYETTAIEYRVHNQEMLELGEAILKKLRKLGKTQASLAKQLQRPIQKQFEANLAESYVVPIKDFHC